MNKTRYASILASFAVVVLAGCTTADPTVYAGLSSAAELRPNPQDKTGRVPYTYRGDVNWQRYGKIMVDPVTIYSGSDNQFVKLEAADKFELASYMRNEFTEKLRSRFAITNTPGPGTLRLRLTLTGARKTTAVLGPLSHIDIAGGVYNTVQATRGGEGSMTGSVSYAVEVYDTQTNQLLYAYVTKQYPNALNVGATLSALEASKAGIRKGADALLGELK
ncbi:DUF3313 domain-containing protein [Rhizobium miluonense]|uniref:DUF3313 domain-containing protein n=1 Tax=Rhizobium miluonense TaxID=411945 RepID=A0A1C3WGJ6_9HYPH|nr:DUF3313 domain-containing protein [Rhizobium miluonense]SCB38996.1 Protein of unknown function [Rhizobium miluonense]